ncbi:TPA: hypothetical protein N0F65_004258 [Lagenidium giganteum]|uniref:Helicase-associated domain-containing protein n=1 Tax=Lagenidium giganteum TaxID=4803 RepID=A0AAV2ZDT5_9STRA|nr:TPA: hypothetical protein N0F65_004258 [Lagenidium giganteum]
MSTSAKDSKNELFLRTLKVFHDRHGHFAVPFEFVVPKEEDNEVDESLEWPKESIGMKLGKNLRLYTRGINSGKKLAALKEYGFPCDDWNTYVWEYQLLEALKIYKEIEGHLYVKQMYDVPEGDPRWPKSTWGFKLGSYAQRLRRDKSSLTPDQIERLDNIGFIWSEVQWRWHDFFLPALRRFFELYGHTVVPRNYIVPEQDVHWPTELWGYRLGFTATQALEKDHSVVELVRSSKEELSAVEFGTSTPDSAWEDRILPALEAFVDIMGHTEVDEEFIVPSESPWPEKSWGLRLGHVVVKICSKHIYATQLQQAKPHLRELGFSWSVLRGKYGRQLLPALTVYRAIHGHADVPPGFIVPQDPAWPSDLWGYRLAGQIAGLRRFGPNDPDALDVIDDLEALGFAFDIQENSWNEKVLPALEVFHEVFGHLNVPQRFVVPAEEPWPKRAWDMKLGTIARGIRNGRQYCEQAEAHRDRLMELDFPWKVKPTEGGEHPTSLWHHAPRPIPPMTGELSGEREKYWNEVVMDSLRAYAEQHGSCADLPESFVIPENDCYPRSAWGINLGLRVRLMRQGTRYVEEVQKYRSELEALGVELGGDE